MSTAFSQNYDQYQQRPQNYSQSLWHVNDHELHHPGDRFEPQESAYIAATIESGTGPLETAPIPQGMILFAEDFVKHMGIAPTELSTMRDVADFVRHFLDYIEPYFLFTDMPVQLTGMQLTRTYRMKQSHSVLSPEDVEIFRVLQGFSFSSTQAIFSILEHPDTVRILRGEPVYHSKTGERLTREDVLNRVMKALWGDLQHHAEEALFQHYQDLDTTRMEDTQIRSLDAYQQRDQLFWYAGFLGCLLWVKSHHSLAYLVEYHPIYYSVLQLVKGKLSLIPESGGEAIVYNYDIFTHAHVTVETSTPPGTCENCKSTLHCTKFINVNAIANPVCSCGKAVDLEDRTGWGHGWSNLCESYRKSFPLLNAYVCQRCLYMAINRLPQDAKCGRKQCPATQCPHHLGYGAYVQAMSDRRRMLLTHRPE